MNWYELIWYESHDVICIVAVYSAHALRMLNLVHSQRRLTVPARTSLKWTLIILGRRLTKPGITTTTAVKTQMLSSPIHFLAQNMKWFRIFFNVLFFSCCVTWPNGKPVVCANDSTWVDAILWGVINVSASRYLVMFLLIRYLLLCSLRLWAVCGIMPSWRRAEIEFAGTLYSSLARVYDLPDLCLRIRPNFFGSDSEG
jgi:hypothetical protein